MNSHFIDFIIGNIFSEAIPVADTFFDTEGVRIMPSSEGFFGSEDCVVCSYALELSWIFNMVLNIYHDELNDRNRCKLLEMMVREAKYYIVHDLPKQAVFLSVINVAEYWFKEHFPYKARIIIEEYGLSECLKD